MIENRDQTIVAISTPPGKGGIAIVRLSGSQAIDIVSQIFISQHDLKKIEPWKAILGKIVDNNLAVDQVIVILYKAPHSYTREDMVEIQGHGGRYVSQRILELTIKHGARLAQPGEFTFRAFLNGRIDLSQAEAVADLIQAQTEASRQASCTQLEGKLSRKINDLRDRMIDYCSLLELELDFSDDDVELVERSEFISRLQEGHREIEKLIATFHQGRIVREGVKLVIAGKPNVGKSSLLNALSREEHAIVTDIPGTTRDPLEVQLDIKGILFRVFDTAGIKETEDRIEREGISRAQKHLTSADIIAHVFDGSEPLEKGDFEIINLIRQLNGRNVIRILNKVDLPQKVNRTDLVEREIPVLSISATQGTGIENFEQKLSEYFIHDNGKNFGEEILVTNVRHWQALQKASEVLTTALAEAQAGISAEFIALYLRDALDFLGQITGKVTSEDILNHIFSRFCVGK